MPEAGKWARSRELDTEKIDEDLDGKKQQYGILYVTVPHPCRRWQTYRFLPEKACFKNKMWKPTQYIQNFLQSYVSIISKFASQIRIKNAAAGLMHSSLPKICHRWRKTNLVYPRFRVEKNQAF
jgi:hypothetical protein